MTQARRQLPQALGVKESLLLDYVIGTRNDALDDIVVSSNVYTAIVDGVRMEPAPQPQRVSALLFPSFALGIAPSLALTLGELLTKLY